MAPFTKKLSLLILIFLIGIADVSAQGGGSKDGFPLGARAAGLGHATATIRDQFAMFNNVAGLTELDGTYANFSYANRFSMAEFQTVGASVVHPFDFGGGIGVSAGRFGDDLYNEQHFSVGYAHQIRLVSLGLKANYVQVSVDGFGTRSVMTLDFGGIAPVTQDIWFGAYIMNLNQAKMADHEDERVPTIMRAGLSYRPFERLMINVETEKDIEMPASVRAGIEYEIVNNIRLRTGISTKAFLSYFGIGFNTDNLQIDYALSNHEDLGLSHNISVGYRIYRPDNNRGE